jgi:riboflavin kinase, archaea type
MPLLAGQVCSGTGDFAHWIAKLESHYLRKTGLRLFPGTLNLRLDRPYRVPPGALRLEAEEYGGTVSVSIVPCRVLGRKCFILRTDGNEHGDGDHPHEIIEIATDVKLRDAFGLNDGDVVEVDAEV